MTTLNQPLSYLHTPQQIWTGAATSNVTSTLPTYNTVPQFSKDNLLIREVIIPYHEDFRQNASMQRVALGNPDYFNTEKLVEHALVHASDGAYVQRENDDHADFSDGSDSKTASIRKAFRSKNSSLGEVSGVQARSGVLKEGALRVIVCNPHTNELMYYYLPKSFWQNCITIHPTSKLGKLVFSYDHLAKEIPKFANFRCDSFKDLATKL